jgi:hypothetical protein
MTRVLAVSLPGIPAVAGLLPAGRKIRTFI